jgi:hypothetical protein
MTVPSANRARWMEPCGTGCASGRSSTPGRKSIVSHSASSGEVKVCCLFIAGRSCSLVTRRFRRDGPYMRTITACRKPTSHLRLVVAISSRRQSVGCAKSRPEPSPPGQPRPRFCARYAPRASNVDRRCGSKCEELEPSISDPLLPSKAEVERMCRVVAFVPGASFMYRSKRWSLDHLVGANEQGGRKWHSERVGGPHVEDQFQLGRLIDG